MRRSFCSAALALRVRPSGESNREASFLSAEEGLLTATLYGGPKSRLRAHVAPFNSGTLWIYRDPAKGFAKVSDFDVSSWRPGLRERWERGEAAYRVAGAILASRGGGGPWPEALQTALEALDALEDAGEDACELITFHFIWRWAGLLGIRSDPEHCCACGHGGDELLWFIRGEGFLCPSCAEKTGRPAGMAAGNQARRWLSMAEHCPPTEAASAPLDGEIRVELAALTSALAAYWEGKGSERY